jgi:radical SAM protein with 4Fe4S-binding SPASM domain
MPTTIYSSFREYRDAWALAYEKDPPVPLNLDLELASLCNLKCPFCFWGEADFNAKMTGKKKLMPTEMALGLIDQAAEIGIPAIKFNWRGESTIHPDFSVILAHSARLDAFHELLVNTNANCKDHALEGLMAATKVMVSLDSVVPETYAVMRVGGTLSRAIEVVQELIHRGHPNLWIRRVIANENKKEPFKTQVDEIFGGKGYKVSEHYCFDRNDDSRHMGERTDGRVYCGYPSQRVMVASAGTCYPCCVDYDTTMPMGNVREQNILDVWNGEKFRTLRRELREGKLTSETCKNCTSWMAYKAPQRDNVQDREAK